MEHWIDRALKAFVSDLLVNTCDMFTKLFCCNNATVAVDLESFIIKSWILFV